MTEKKYDVAIVGGSLAGCAAATFLGRAGRRVAVLESHTDPRAYKKICTTVILPSTVPTVAVHDLGTTLRSETWDHRGRSDGLPSSSW